MAVLKIGLLGVAVLALLGAGMLMIHIAALARELPNLPLHARVNPFNILVSRDRWTPEIERLHSLAVTCGVVFLIAVLVFTALSFLEMSG